MVNITVKDVLEATRGELLCGNDNIELTDVSTDSRETKNGDLYVPIIGEKVDGHRFIESALEKASATLTSEHEGVVDSSKPYIKVKDTQKALQDLGAYIRNRYTMPVVGVTGSVGKTTTREMITAAISVGMKCFHTEGNYNSQIGVPITLSKMTGDYEAAVIEMGISDFGHMDILSNMVKPDICVVTVIGVAHIEYMKTQENIRKEKLSIINAMSEGGLLLLNGDDELLRAVKDDMPCRVMTYGCSDDCDFKGANIRIEDDLTVFECVHEDQTVTVRMNAMGKHNVRNALAGIAVAYNMGIPMDKTKDAFEDFSGLRQRVLKIENKYTILDDTYNASPDSMKASIDVLCDMDVIGKKYAVLGDMFELGVNSLVYHREVGEYICNKKIDEVIVIGEDSQEIKKAIEECETSYATTASFANNSEVAEYLKSKMNPEDVVLIKGSNGMHLNEVVNILAE